MAAVEFYEQQLAAMRVTTRKAERRLSDAANSVAYNDAEFAAAGIMVDRCRVAVRRWIERRDAAMRA